MMKEHMQNESKCPECHAENIYADGNLWICPECSHEWSALVNHNHGNELESTVEQKNAVRDAHGNVLADGDSVTVIKDLKIKGSSSVVKVGTKVKNIRITDAGDGHDIACKIDGLGSINLKSEFVKKS
jgi:protein PhnA